MGELGGSNVKIVAVYDICREPIEPLKKNIQEALDKHAAARRIASPRRPHSFDEIEELEELKDTEVEEQKEGRGFHAEVKRASNYFSIHGTTAGGLVAAKSNLAIEIL